MDFFTVFAVKPLEIDRRKFRNSMSDRKQERTRQIIQDAFYAVDKCPKKYSAPFYTMIPKKNWKGDKTVEQLKAYANDLGGSMADWVEQALEWAQRISNGESWETICNNADTAHWYRLIEWMYNGGVTRVGGSSNLCYCESASEVHLGVGHMPRDTIAYTVPLVVFKIK